MEVTKRTRMKELFPLLTTKERMDSVLEQVEEYPLDKDILSMTVGEFINLSLDEEKYIASLLRPNELAYKALGRLKNYYRQMKQLTQWIKKFDVKQTAEEKQAAISVDFPDMMSRMLLTVTQFFGLKSFKEAESVPLSDWLLILRDQSTAIQYQRNYSKLLDMKSKTKKKK